MTRIAVTIWQPWATLIVRGLKAYEFRRWPAPRRLVGRRIVIHAAKRPPDHVECRTVMMWPHRTCGVAAIGEDRLRVREICAAAGTLPLAAGVGEATLGTPVRARECQALVAIALDMSEDPDELDPDMWAWPMLEPQEWAAPIQARGRQGFWEWEPAPEPWDLLAAPG